MKPLLHLPHETSLLNKSTIDVIELVQKNNWNELNHTPTCIDKYDIVRARFGDNKWDCSPYATDKGSDQSQRVFDFTYLIDTPELLLQSKLIVYGWIYIQGNILGRKCKLSTLASRFNTGLKKILVSLIQDSGRNITDLNNYKKWYKLEETLKAQNFSRRTLELSFTALQAISGLNYWLPFQLELPNKSYKQLARKLSCRDKLESKQTLAIPQTLTEKIYGEAIKDVELAWPHRKKLAELERNLQSNYDIGRSRVDYKLATGRWTWLYDKNGELNKKSYVEEINKATPKSQTEIIAQHLAGTKLLPKHKADGNWLVRWRTKLQTACFICAGAFSGMRVSELFELHEDSFFTRTINGQVFHSVSAATHKLAAGAKHDEWLTSPITEKAISLAIELSACAREQLVKVATHSSDPGQVDKLIEISSNLWLSQIQRKNMPILITRSKWNDKLKKYSEKVGAIVSEADLRECRQLNPRDGGSINDKVELGKPWPLLTHQFRRTFACFAVRNNLGHPISIKQQFKHLSLRMSEWYVNGAIESRIKDISVDTELINLLNEAKIEQTTAHLDRWFNGEEQLGGTYGKAIVAMRNDKPVIYSNWDNLYRLVKEERLTLHGTLHSYCKNGHNCDMDGLINPAFCVDCRTGGSVIDLDKALWWQKKHEVLGAYLHKSLDINRNEFAHCITQIRAAEKVMDEFKIKFVKYEHPVHIIDL